MASNVIRIYIVANMHICRACYRHGTYGKIYTFLCSFHEYWCKYKIEMRSVVCTELVKSVTLTKQIEKMAKMCEYAMKYT